MKIRVLLFAILFLASKQLFGQAKIRKMPANINHTAINNYAPYVALDGNSVLYIADVAEDNALTVNYTARDGADWRDPVILPKHVNNRLNFLKGYALSPDGKTLFFTSGKSNGLGGYDIYTSERNGNSWAEPVNLSLPINSKTNDAAPSLSVDGSTLYFMRCEVMNGTSADKCKMMMTKKKPNGLWDDPVDLPASLNTGNSQTPRIMGDSETLIFSSNKLQPNKGGMDLYLTKIINGQWTAPQPMDFVNTPGDDQYVSASAIGRYLLKDAPGQHNNELLEVLFPPDLRPITTIKIEGTVAGPENPSSAFVSVFDMKDQRRVFSTKPGKDGFFIAYVREGAVYDLSVDPEKDNYTFFSKSFDLTGDKNSTVEKVNIKIKPASAADEIQLDGISFVAGSSEISPTSTQELRRVERMMAGNPERSFTLSVTLFGYQVDSLMSSPDLTETLTDTVRIPVTYKIDSATFGTRDSLIVKWHYHNDRTTQQASVLGAYFVKKGIASDRINFSSQAIPEALIERRRTVVKVIIR